MYCWQYVDGGAGLSMCMLVTWIYDRAGLGIIEKMDVTTGNEPSGSR